MGSEAEAQASAGGYPTTPKLPLFSLLPQPLGSPEHPGTLTPPLHTHASVPFLWEQVPGKPLPCTTLALPLEKNDIIKSLELPPRLLNETKVTNVPSPTTVLEGPYSYKQVRAKLESSSFRFLRKRQGSFDGSLSLGGSGGSSPERGLLGAIVVRSSNSNNSSIRNCKRENSKGLFGSWRKRGGFVLKGKSEVHGDTLVLSSFSDDGIVDDDHAAATVTVTTNSRKKRTLLSLSNAKSHFWATIYGTFKQVIPRRSAKWKKDAI